MSIGNMGSIAAASVAGTQEAQKNTGTDRTAVDARNQERRVQSTEKADRAAGVGSSDDASNEADNERDADGRQAWERPKRPGARTPEQNAPQAKDTSGKLGNTLDLNG